MLGIPVAYLGTRLNQAVDQRVLLLAFAALTLAAAVVMLINYRSRRPAPTPEAGSSVAPTGGTATKVDVDRRHLFVTAAKVVLSGLAVGFVTGFLGVGGGFLVVPALVISLRTPIPPPSAPHC